MAKFRLTSLPQDEQMTNCWPKQSHSQEPGGNQMKVWRSCDAKGCHKSVLRDVMEGCSVTITILQQKCWNRTSPEKFLSRHSPSAWAAAGTRVWTAGSLVTVCPRSKKNCLPQNIFLYSNTRLSHKHFSVFAYTTKSQIVFLYLSRSQIQSIHFQSLSPHYPFSFLLFFSPSGGKPQALS